MTQQQGQRDCARWEQCWIGNASSSFAFEFRAQQRQPWEHIPSPDVFAAPCRHKGSKTFKYSPSAFTFVTVSAVSQLGLQINLALQLSVKVEILPKTRQSCRTKTCEAWTRQSGHQVLVRPFLQILVHPSKLVDTSPATFPVPDLAMSRKVLRR